MAFKDFRNKAQQRDSGEKLPRQAATETTYIDEGCTLSGKLRFSETVRIDGEVEGELSCQETLIIGESSHIRAKIKCESAVVFGAIDGDVIAKRKITLHKSARVIGQMQTAGIVIEEGATFKGQILIGSDDAPAPVVRPESLPKPPPHPGASKPGAAHKEHPRAKP